LSPGTAAVPFREPERRATRGFRLSGEVIEML
jgi:hypothetical protein